VRDLGPMLGTLLSSIFANSTSEILAFFTKTNVATIFLHKWMDIESKLPMVSLQTFLPKKKFFLIKTPLHHFSSL
jgi:hypothetical protein